MAERPTASRGCWPVHCRVAGPLLRACCPFSSASQSVHPEDCPREETPVLRDLGDQTGHPGVIWASHLNVCLEGFVLDGKVEGWGFDIWEVDDRVGQYQGPKPLLSVCRLFSSLVLGGIGLERWVRKMGIKVGGPDYSKNQLQNHSCVVPSTTRDVWETFLGTPEDIFLEIVVWNLQARYRNNQRLKREEATASKTISVR